jgi:hydroxypyruvate reductase
MGPSTPEIRFRRERVLDPALPGPVRARRALALELAEAALAAVEPGRATHRALRDLCARGERLDGATLFAFGKAAVPMARAAVEGARPAGGIVVALEAASLPGLEVRRGGHPDPAPDAVETGRAVLARAEALGAGDRALCLVSGGGSAMLELPRRGVSLEELTRVGAELREAGADIGELNAVRRALSRLKGGGLARAIAPAAVLNVILSDVPGHPLEVVASGPTCPPPARPAPRAVLERYGMLGALSDAARRLLDRPLDRGVSTAIRTALAADDGTARRAARKAAAERGLALSDREGWFAGEARALGARIAAEPHARSWVWGGETTVRVRGRGHGGRNQEVALGALAAGLREGTLVCFGSDGVDGRSDAAGALVDATAVEEARRRGLEPERFLAENDSTAFFDAVGTTLRCGPTSTNVADVALFLA